MPDQLQVGVHSILFSRSSAFVPDFDYSENFRARRESPEYWTLVIEGGINGNINRWLMMEGLSAGDMLGVHDTVGLPSEVAQW